MSISAITNILGNHQNVSNQLQNSQLRQLGQDLTAGDLSAAQSDLAMLQQAFAQIPTVSSSSSTSNPVAQAFSQLSKDVQSGNVSAAKQDYSTVQQSLMVRAGSSHLHRYHPVGKSNANSLLQDLSQLGQDLSSSTFLSGNGSAAQQAYAMPVQAFGTGAQMGGLGAGSQASMVAPVSDQSVSFLA